jgi:cytochrome c-type biogenesis protein CcmH
MLFWLTAALLTLGASVAVLWPFLRRTPHALANPAAHDLEVYRDQLSEIERDAAAGLVGPAEAEEARAEIGRRILRAAAEQDGASAARSDRLGKSIVTAAVLTVPLLGWGVYAVLGSPGRPDQRLESRLAKNPAESSIDELVARAEQHLRENPEDGRGWDVLAPIYLRMRRGEDAAIAFRNAIRLNGPSVVREAGLGEALTSAAGGMVTAEAQDAFERALAIEPDDARSRFFLALGLAQEGKTAEARDMWRQMADRLPQDSPWRGAAEQAVARAGQTEGTPADRGTEEGQAGPTREQMDSAAGMSPEDRNAMIEGMVAQLDARLRENPADPQGWQRLIQSYHVLGRTDEAREALARGIEGLGAGTPAADELTRFAAALGISEMEQQ